MSIDELKLRFEVPAEIFEKAQQKIIRRFTKNVFPTDKPIAIILGGQPGSGKSELIAKAQALLKGNIVICNADLYREFHPDYEEIITQHEAYYPEITASTAQAWNNGLRAYCEKHSLNFVMETTFSSGTRMNQTLREIKALNYTVYIMLIALPRKLSLIGTYLRYEAAKRTTGQGRLVDEQIHDQKYAEIPITLQLVQKAKLYDHILIYRREGGNTDQFDTQNKVSLAAEDPTDPLSVYLAERDRPWDDATHENFNRSYQSIINMMQVRNAGDDAVSLFKSVFL